MTQQHTPVPWVTKPFSGKYKNEGFCINATDEDATRIADVTNHYYVPSEANARFIVQACNAHEELLAVLELALRYLEHPDVLAVTQHMALPGSVPADRARAAIAKAKGG